MFLYNNINLLNRIYTLISTIIMKIIIYIMIIHIIYILIRLSKIKIKFNPLKTILIKSSVKLFKNVLAIS